jgi:hypothetical protein
MTRLWFDGLLESTRFRTFAHLKALHTLDQHHIQPNSLGLHRGLEVVNRRVLDIDLSVYCDGVTEAVAHPICRQRVSGTVLRPGVEVASEDDLLAWPRKPLTLR